MSKNCRTCKKNKPHENFYTSKSSQDGYRLDCIECYCNIGKERRKRQAEEKKSKHYEIQSIDINSFDWQVGKCKGTVCLIKKDGHTYWTGMISNIDGYKQKSIQKGFRIDEYGDEKAKQKAVEWRFVKCKELGLIKNRIRILSDRKTIEVQLNQNKTMFTDIEFINLVQKYTLKAVCHDQDSKLWYVHVKIEGKDTLFHIVITGFGMTNHINRNGLDNRRINLEETTHKDNMRNVSLSRKNTSGTTGVSLHSTGEYWIATIYADENYKTKSFSIREYGDEGAKQRAIEKREKWNQKYGNKNGKILDNVPPPPPPGVVYNVPKLRLLISSSNSN